MNSPLKPRNSDTSDGRLARVISLIASTALITATVLAISAAPAMGSEAITSFETTSSDTAAGGHPDLTTSFELEKPGNPEVAQNVTFDSPRGLFGDPAAITQCTASDFALDQCPSDSQAGLITVYANYAGQSRELLGTAPLFSIEPAVSQTALFAFIAPIIDLPIDIPVSVRTGAVAGGAGDYGLRFTVSDITQLIPLAAARLTVWGLPAEVGHLAQRFPKGTAGVPANCAGLTTTACITEPTPSSIPVRPLISNPTTCTSRPLETSLEVQTYADPSGPSTASASYPATTQCESEVFYPVLAASPTTSETDAPSGLNVDLSAPQFQGFAVSPSELKAAEVTLPEGFTINPDAADGQADCPEPQAKLESEEAAECPDSSKIGTFTIGSEALPGRLEGSIYIGEPRPGDQYRLLLTASGFGIHVKLIGSAVPDETTGRLTIHFPELPQAPFSDFQLHLFASDRGLMATPTACTIYTTDANFIPWNEALPAQHSSQIFGLTEGPHHSECPGQVRPFHPTLDAGTGNAEAGAFSSFSLKLNREDGDQFLGHLNFTMPPGLTANLHGVSYCPEASILAAAKTLGRTEQAEPSCPASSEIGTTNVAAGPGEHPFHADGKMYLGGPFQGAPLSLAAITPALAGPYDYGTVVVRVALHIDPQDAHVIADSEAMPEIIGGIPIRMREIRVNINREHFMINPTNCSPFTVGSEGIGNQGTAVAFASPFQAVNCFSLPFAPRMSITQLGGHKATARSKDPSLAIELNTRPGDANIKSVAVTLPKAFEIDQRHLGNICDRSELASDRCAGRQPIGEATTTTPLLEKPLKGPVYAVSGYGLLPHLAFILGGQVMLTPEAESSTLGQTGRLKTVVPVVPDAPIGNFRFTLFGGSQGYLANTQNLCSLPITTTIEFTAQNGKTETQQVKAKTACKAKKTKRRSRRRR